MPAFIWNTNHLMWKVVPPFTDSLAVLKAYITDPSAYVYWSTPRFHEDIKVGDTAYVFCTVDNQGIVARGTVAEAPRQLTLTNAAQFAQGRAPHARRLGRGGRAVVVEDRHPHRAHLLGRAAEKRQARARHGRARER